VSIVAIEHVQLAMPHGGEDQARRFYCGVLGMDEVPKPEHLVVGGGCWFIAGGAEIHLGVEAEFRPSRKAHPALLLDDLNEQVAQLAAHGYDFIPGKPLTGYIRGDTHDPFGNRIELMQAVGVDARQEMERASREG
jgi:catechol 2,3-dioxygenase-like lactoylglutathione lyase family enzyme